MCRWVDWSEVVSEGEVDLLKCTLGLGAVARFRGE